MTDPIEVTQETQTPPEPTPPAVEAPVASPVDVEAIKTQLRTEFDQQMQTRVTGLQKLISDREQEIERLKLESLPEEDREKLEIERQEAYYTNIERENWLWRKAGQSDVAAEAADLLYRFMEAQDRDAQFDVLISAITELRGGTAAPAAETGTESVAVADVDRNNPAPQLPGQVMLAPDGTPIDSAFAEQYLKSMKEWPY